MDRERLQWIYRSYYAAISQVDKEIGLILNTLGETGQAENTIIILINYVSPGTRGIAEKIKKLYMF